MTQLLPFPTGRVHWDNITWVLAALVPVPSPYCGLYTWVWAEFKNPKFTFSSPNILNTSAHCIMAQTMAGSVWWEVPFSFSQRSLEVFFSPLGHPNNYSFKTKSKCWTMSSWWLFQLFHKYAHSKVVKLGGWLFTRKTFLLSLQHFSLFRKPQFVFLIWPHFPSCPYPLRFLVFLLINFIV